MVQNDGRSQTRLSALTDLNISMRIVNNPLEDHKETVSTGGKTIANLCFADEIEGLAGKEEEIRLQPLSLITWISPLLPFAWKLA